MQLRKFNYPACAVLPNVKFDIERLRAEVAVLNEQWVNVFQANRGLCATHEDLAQDNHGHFDQINLTYFEPSLNDFLDLSDLKAECKIIANSTTLGLTKTQRHRTKINRLDSLPPAMNEHNWFHQLPIYENSYIKQAIDSQFKAKPIRVRLTRLKAGKYLTPHIDYDTTYAVRIIVPISGTDGVTNVFWPKNERQEVHMAADGSAYFLNVGYKHSVEHNGNQDRIALMFSLPTQEDIQDLVLSV
jgi:Aspartyl/Asparaginyl beta-hydroxylase